MLLWNILLAMVWAALNGSFKPTTLLTGFVVGFLLLSALSIADIAGSRAYTKRVWRSIGFAGFFLWELVLANLRLSADLCKDLSCMEPGIVRVPLDVETEAEIGLLTSLITLTPGTLSMDVSSDKKALFVHSMYIRNGDRQKVIDDIKNGFERRVLELFRGGNP
jgi:multicomponent Na+:H+ antiporter subunit E